VRARSGPPETPYWFSAEIAERCPQGREGFLLSSRKRGPPDLPLLNLERGSFLTLVSGVSHRTICG
jgi:hypothetical protein